MTLILTCVTPHYAIQASDRLLTMPNGDTFEDRENKATLVCNVASFAYSGLSDVHLQEKTHELMLRSLSSDDPNKKFDEIVEQLRVNASAALRRVTWAPNVMKRTTFVGSGFLAPNRPLLRDPRRLTMVSTDSFA